MAKQEILRVYCIRNTGYNLKGMRGQVQKAIEHAFSAGVPGEPKAPIAILANESTLYYRFGITQDKVIRAVEGMQQDMPEDSWIAVAFNIFQKSSGCRNAEHSNTGYLFTKNKILFQPKRRLTQMDDDILNRHSLKPVKQKKLWRARGNEMQKKGTPYPTLAMPNGYSVNYYICADMTSRPLPEDNVTVILVSADGLLYPDIMANSLLHKYLVVNDLQMKEVLVKPACACEISRLDKSMTLVSIIGPQERELPTPEGVGFLGN